MENKKIDPKEVLLKVIKMAIGLNAVTDVNEDLSAKVKVIQRATSLSILQPAFEFMKETGNEKMEKLVDKYMKDIDYLCEKGIIKEVDILEEIETFKAKKKDEKNNSCD
jgi:hypothetical protein